MENESKSFKSKVSNAVANITWLRVVLYVLCVLGVTAVFQVLAFSVYAAVYPEAAKALQNGFMEVDFLFLVQLLGLAATLIVTGVFLKQINGKSFEHLGFDLTGKFEDAIFAFVLGLALIALGFGILNYAGLLSVTAIKFQPLALLGYFALCIIISLNEEIMVRGYVLGNLMDTYNKYRSLVASAILFGVLHMVNPNLSLAGVLNILLAGILLGVYYIHRRNLWFPLALHLSWNFFQGPVFGFEVSGMDMDTTIFQSAIAGKDWLSGGEFGFEGSYLLTILLLLSIALVHFKYKNG